MRSTSWLYSAITLLAMLFLIVSTLVTVSAQIEQVKLSFLQGETTGLPIKELIGFSPSNFEVVGIPFASKSNNYLDVVVPITQEPNSYVGYILADEIKIPLVIDISSKESSLDVKLIIKKQELEAGDNVGFYVDVTVLNSIERTFLDVTYEFKGLSGELISTEQKRELIEASKTFPGTIYLPTFLESGKYVATVKVSHRGEVLAASEFFSVKEKLNNGNSNASILFFLLPALLVIIVLVFILTYFKTSARIIVKNQPKDLRKIYSDFKKTKGKTEAIKKLKKQKEILHRAYKLGTISKKLRDKATNKISSLTEKVEGKPKRKLKLKQKAIKKISSKKVKARKHRNK